MTEEQEEKVVLPHHEQQALCTTRLPYRQGRQLTAVKVYTINNESRHLLVFGVPSLKLRQEARSLFAKYGKLLQFAITTKYPTEAFTETYHATFEKIQAARIAKKMLDAKNFYGGSLHICYAPELEDVDDTRSKIHERQRNVLGRLKNLQNEADAKPVIESKSTETIDVRKTKKLNMGEINVIGVGKQVRDVVFNKTKRKMQQPNVIIEKKFKPCFVAEETRNNEKETTITNRNSKGIVETSNDSEIEVIDCTSVEKDTITNINESLNYNKFGNETIKKIPQKPVNTIKFNLNNKKS